MPHTPKFKPVCFRFPVVTDDALDAVAAELSLNRSDTVRFLVHEKLRALGLSLSVRDEGPRPASRPPEPAPPATPTPTPRARRSTKGKARAGGRR
jgi:hypothetical protein